MGSTVADWLPLLPQCKDVLWSDSNLKCGFCIFSQCLQGFPSGASVSSQSGELDTQNSVLYTCLMLIGMNSSPRVKKMDGFAVVYF